MTILSKWCAIVVILLIPTLARADVPPIQLLTEEYPPLTMSISPDGEVGGAVTDIVRELFKRLRIHYSLELMPWPRAYNAALLEKNVCLFPTTRTLPREAKFKWVGPLMQNPWVMYGRVSHPALAISSLEEIRRYKIGSYNGDAIAQYLTDKYFNVELAASDELNIKKLLVGHIDFWATGKHHGAWLIEKDKKLQQQIKPIFIFDNSHELYLACNMGIADATIRQLNETLRGMKCSVGTKCEEVIPPHRGGAREKE